MQPSFSGGFSCLGETMPPRLIVQGRFDLAATTSFRQTSLSLLADNPVELRVDLTGVQFIDSSALGSLLQLRQECGQRNCRIILDHCSEPVLRVLRIANFTKLFTLNP